MQFIMFTKHLQGCNLKEIVSALKSIGMDGADLCVRHGFPVTPRNSAKMLPRAVQAFKDEGMSVPLITAPGSFTDPKDKYAEALFAACRESGVKLIKLGYWRFNPGDDYWKLVRNSRRQLQGFARLARKHGVKAVYHTHSGDFMGLNASSAMHLVDGFNPKEIGLFVDVGHLGVNGEPVRMALSITRKYLSCLAFKDVLGIPVHMDDGRYIHAKGVSPMGWGGVDWQEVVRTVLDMKLHNLPVSLHSEYSVPPKSVVDIARVDLRFIKKLFGDLGSGRR